MRIISIFRHGVAACVVLGLSACGGGGGGGSPSPTNTPPISNFALTCVDLACSFTSTSTDQDVGDAIAGFSWAFGDGAAAASPAPSHTFAAAGAYDVALTVADRSGMSSSITRRVTVTTAPAPAAPHAAFDVSCVSLDCTFTDTTAYDPGSALQSRTWDFGDGVTLAATNPATHHYAVAALATFATRLTVIDTSGKTSTSTRSIQAAPPATTLNCVGGNCVLTLTQAARVSAGLVSHSCSAQGNKVIITAPIAQTIFPDGCVDPVGTVVALDGGNVFAANTQLEVSVLSGFFPASTLAFTPTIRVTGDFASGWTLTFDDGYGGPSEPDFNDLVILIRATP